ncbi:class I SAM-dependent methyltransferase [Thermococcus sp. Bubb.Bath]|uniref:class I SAM-dependent methyltransferase n=1 Tax=Thermococcus sp. Bubb.Bath TaxID=1638242 RepID=UPI00143CB24C|nr:class I SAM-dependent methyltransferase [Thermococcus sp. Bubb.Bath]
MNEAKPEPNWAFKMIELIHDNPLMRRLRNPYRMLKDAGLEKGMKVLEVGCGPGVFTIPAAELVGENGVVYAIDIHPRAIEKVREKAQRAGAKNVIPILANAAKTGLPDESIDLAFVFGLKHAAGGLESIIREIHRVLKPGGILAYETRSSKIKTLIKKLGFEFLEKKGNILRFRKL